MNDNRYAPPSTAVTDVERAPPDRPRSVVNGVRLLWLSALCAVPAVIYELVVPPADVTPVENVLINLGALAFGLGLAWIFNSATWRGRNWGRIVNLVMVILAGISMFFMLYMTVRMRKGPDYLAEYGMPWYMLTQYLVQNAISAVGLVLLFSRSANAWFREMKDV